MGSHILSNTHSLPEAHGVWGRMAQWGFLSGQQQRPLPARDQHLYPQASPWGQCFRGLEDPGSAQRCISGQDTCLAEPRTGVSDIQGAKIPHPRPSVTCALAQHGTQAGTRGYRAGGQDMAQAVNSYP